MTIADDRDARIAQLEVELAAARQREAEARAQKSALAEVLRVIATSPTSLQRVLDTITESAAI